MPKRFTSTEIWMEDWFLDMPNEYKLFWYCMLSNCNHAGLYKVNMRSISRQFGVNLSPLDAITYFNEGKSRIRVISDTLWLIEDFFVYQYGQRFNPNNRVHESVKKEYEKYGICLSEIRGLIEVTDTLKDKDKDKDKDKEKDISTTQSPTLVKPIEQNFSKKINPQNENHINSQTQTDDFLTRRLLELGIAK